jgi:signal transduction histidine kinase
MANTLSNMARYEEALGLYEIAGELFSKLRPNIPPAIILHNRGATLAQMKRYSEAEELLLESLRITNDMGILQGVYFNHHILGNMYFEQGRSEEAVYHLENAIDAAEEIGNMQQAQTSRDVLHKTYAQANRFKKAYESLNDFKIYSDSLTNIVKEKELAELESRLELIRQSEFNRLLEEKQVQQEQQLNFQFYLIIAAIVVIVLVVVILFIMRKSAREREEINSKLQQQKLELEELGHAKDKLFAIITHDLRSPLTSLQGILHLIKDNVLSNQDMAELIPELEVSIQKNVDVMDDLLQWAKEQLSGVKMNIKPVNIHQIVDEIISSQSFIAQKKGVTVKQEIPKEETVMADVNALQLVIRNLISNSIKFTSRGDEVQVILHSNHAHTQLVIKDTGIGIPKEAADKIFDSKSWTRPGTNKEKGSGFGLSLSKEFVERMGGRIWFESEDGKGSTFYIELPKG